jgi:hypothetical protein
MPEEEVIINEIAAEETPVNNISFSATGSTDDEIVVDETPQDTEVIVEDAVVPEEPEDEYEVLELDENTAWQFLKGKRGFDVDSIDDFLSSKEQKKYAPEMEKFNEFIEKTGNKNYNDYLETQKDWNTESDEIRLRSFIKLSNPDLSDKEVNRLYDRKYNINDLDEDLDEDEILDRGISIKTDLKKANEFFENRKQEFNAVGGSDEYVPIAYREAKQQLEDQAKQEEDYIIDRDAKRNTFIARTEALFNRDFEGFKIKLGDEKIGFEEHSIRPENLNDIKEQQLDSNNFINKFLDKDTGEINDPRGYHEAVYMATNYKTELNKAYNLGMAKQLEIYDKLSKNIQPDNIRNAPSNVSSGISFEKA